MRKRFWGEYDNLPFCYFLDTHLCRDKQPQKARQGGAGVC